ncbi:MAG: menaquinone biosynthesis protein [Bacteroidota bacterium]
MSKYKATAVSYLNTKPLLYGLVTNPVLDLIELQTDIPSVCADKLINRAVDLALIPVAAIPSVPNAEIISDYCIGTKGTVKTVCIYSDRPIEEVEVLHLDYHSRTSVALTKILLEEYWQVSPLLIDASPGYIDKIQGGTAGLVIGDRTIGLEEQFAYVYDLGEIWEKHTGMPFVFAAWVSNRQLDKSFIEQFNAALAHGLDHINELMLILPSPAPGFDLKAYFTHYISYELDRPKRKALDLFLTKLKANKPSK